MHWQRCEKKQQKLKPRPAQIDYPAVEAAITRYATDRTEVRFSALWKAIVAAVPAADNVHRTEGAPFIATTSPLPATFGNHRQ